MNDPESNVHLRIDGAIGEVILGRGTRRNALGRQDWRRLEQRCHELAAHRDLRVVLVHGAGDTFSAGSDIREWVRADVSEVDASFAAMESAFTAIEALPVPVVAEVSGAAAGAGCQLALACDLRVMAASARIGMPIARLGILASPTFAARLAELAGPAVARELLYTGRLLAAPEAVQLGLANHWVPDAELSGATHTLVAAIAAQPTEAIRAAKRAVATALAPGRLAAASTGGHHSVSVPDFQGAVTAFLDRRARTSQAAPD